MGTRSSSSSAGPFSAPCDSPRTGPNAGNRAIGNALIAFSVILPGVSGTMAKIESSRRFILVNLEVCCSFGLGSRPRRGLRLHRRPQLHRPLERQLERRLELLARLNAIIVQ
jgi:hypothetical protein